MPTACINQPDCRIHLKSERLQIVGRSADGQKEEVLREIPLRDLDRLILIETTQITSQAMAALLRAQAPVSFMGWNGDFLGGFLPATKAHGLARVRQYQKTLDPEFSLMMAGRIITAKLYNQRRVLQRLALNRSDTDDLGAAVNSQGPAKEAVRETLAWLDGLFAGIQRSKTIDELRGYEGAATARYFQAWARFLPERFPFERRSTRPPHNPVNACISFAATLVYSEMAAFTLAHGLDPALGLLHATEDGRWSLALDLMEPFRPVMIEALALDLFSHEIVNQSHFEPNNGGIYLNEEGRKKFFLQYERRMERQFMSESVGCRTTLRQQLENQVTMFKAALDDSIKFEPFLVN